MFDKYLIDPCYTELSGASRPNSQEEFNNMNAAATRRKLEQPAAAVSDKDNSKPARSGEPFELQESKKMDINSSNEFQFGFSVNFDADKMKESHLL
jgi:hypothetical protein